MSNKKVCVVVIGDIGRSPRMQYHSLSLADEGYNVVLLGYGGSQPIEKVMSHPKIKIQHLTACPEFKNHLPTILAYCAKVLWQAITLFIALVISSFPDYVILQNPPGVPSLGVCYIFSKIFRAKFTIDWHNYGYSILALSLRETHKLVKISKWFEFFFGKLSDSNICVTKSMKDDLYDNHKIKCVTLYDRPPDMFKTVSINDRHDLFIKLGIEFDIFAEKSGTVFTEMTEDGSVKLRSKRPALLVSSTSWTEDEDFSILLDALQYYEESCIEQENLPDVICAITGKGPLKEFYKKIIERRKWKHVKVLTPWLEPNDYPLFLACADLGVSLHTSSSGLDLPMKVVDMFGCQIPVCAIDFNCVSELVKHEQNGFIFHDSKELSQQLKTWFNGFPNQQNKFHEIFKENLTSFASLRWHENWKLNALPLFK